MAFKKLLFINLFGTLFFLTWTNCCLSQELERRISLSDSTKSSYKSSIRIGTPTNKEIEMELNDYTASFYRYDVRYTNHWFNLKEKINAKSGIQLSINYSSIFMGASSKISDENRMTAASGIFDATVKWTFINRKSATNQGSIIFWTDSRHLYYGSVTPQLLNFETGSALIPAGKFNKWSYRALVVYYQQGLFNNRAGFAIGKIDLPDWLNYHGLMHPLLHFADFALIAGLNDVSGEDISNKRFLDWGAKNISSGKFLKMVEFQFTPGRSEWASKRISVTAWHSDELLESDESFFTSPSSKGITFQASWVINDRYTPVFTLGISDGEGTNTLATTSVSLMNGWFFTSHDLIGIGLNYTKSAITDTGQFLAEAIYRFTLSKTTSFTPVLKFVIDPVLHPDKEFLLYYGIRSRISI